MPVTKNAKSAASILENLKSTGFHGGDIKYKDKVFGRYVAHGHPSGNGKTVYSSRVYLKCGRIEVSGMRPSSMLSGVAKALSALAKDGKLDLDNIE